MAATSWPASGSASTARAWSGIPKKAFDEAGYKVPTTWDELIALQDQIAADGDTPWCIGIESGAATGWPATDWIEEIMLRTTSLENYDKWVKGELKFDSPEVKKAVETMAEIWLDDKYVYGGDAGHRLHLLRRCADADVRRSAQVLAAPAGQLHHQLLPGRGKVAAWTTTSSTCRRSTRPTASPSWWPATSRPCSRTGPKRVALLECFTKGEHLKPWMAPGGARPAQGRRPRLVRQ